MTSNQKTNTLYSVLALAAVVVALIVLGAYLVRQNAITFGRKTEANVPQSTGNTETTMPPIENEKDLDEALKDIDSLNFDEITKDLDQNERDLSN